MGTKATPTASLSIVSACPWEIIIGTERRMENLASYNSTFHMGEKKLIKMFNDGRWNKLRAKSFHLSLLIIMGSWNEQATTEKPTSDNTVSLL